MKHVHVMLSPPPHLKLTPALTTTTTYPRGNRTFITFFFTLYLLQKMSHTTTTIISHQALQMADSDPESTLREQDRFLPIANVSRIMKKAVPANGKISKEAKETVQECVSEFVSFVTGEASDKCRREKRKTINGDDLLWAMTTLGFEEYVEVLRVYLQRYRDVEEEKSALAGAGRGGAEDDGGGWGYGGGRRYGSPEYYQVQLPQESRLIDHY